MRFWRAPGFWCLGQPLQRRRAVGGDEGTGWEWQVACAGLNRTRSALQRVNAQLIVPQGRLIKRPATGVGTGAHLRCPPLLGSLAVTTQMAVVEELGYVSFNDPAVPAGKAQKMVNAASTLGWLYSSIPKPI